MPRYEIRMSNGDCAEADTFSALLLAAVTLRDDSEGTATPTSVELDGEPSEVMLQITLIHLDETPE